jgi:serine/threonine protein kinase
MQDEEAVLGGGEGDTNWHADEAGAAGSHSVSKVVRFNGENGVKSIKGSGPWSEEEEPETPKSGGFLKRETSTLFGWLGGHGAEDEGYSTSSSTAEDKEFLEEEEEEDKELLAAQEEKKKARSAMLVQAIKSKKGRRRFIDWLYRLADTTESDSITMGELVTFLKAIHADGINPEVFIDPSEDYGDDAFDAHATPVKRGGDGGRQSSSKAPVAPPTASPTRRRQAINKHDPAYLDIVGSRIMMRYNESHSGQLSREEFMQLATMVEREYELLNTDSERSAAERVGPYRFIRTLGRGAEGVVKLAINSDDESAGKRAIKIIKRGNIASLARIDTEIEAMVLLDHPTVVVCFEVLETESNICLVMEYCAGGHIEDYISPTRPMTESAARFYFTQLIDGLSYCHEQCVCHRDLRIENLMLDNKGDLKITDFGHAGIFQQGWDVFQTMLVGSVSHLAPEQVLGTVYSGEKIDMWSVGVILYIMVTGTAPFAGETVDELLEHIKEAKYEQIEPGLDVALECLDVLAATLQVDYKDRPGCQQIKLMQFMKGPREKLVLAHCDFFISAPQKNSEQIIMDIRCTHTKRERERERKREREREKERKREREKETTHTHTHIHTLGAGWRTTTPRCGTPRPRTTTTSKVTSRARRRWRRQCGRQLIFEVLCIVWLYLV